jgi:hypothetical protein
MAFQEPNYMGDFAKALDEGINLQKQKKSFMDSISEINKKLSVVNSVVPMKTKTDNSKVLKTMEYFTEQIDIKKKKADETMMAKEKYIKYLEEEKERKLREIMSYYEKQITKAQESIDKTMDDRDAYIISCSSRIQTNELKILETEKSPAIQKLETQKELLEKELEMLEEKIANNVKEQHRIQTMW